ncbi:urocanate hydratase [Candidatus Xianfuyuplasma coldseepsis]|uniref:Urocanate hydratase n=1 Tax=Candidatus Xianfuyuplasma coldseepsis TaxID=2782163 RepID=A0A7L7KS80_9MOLU|nr:urocanate hydratase [Xianfuyuplasma coldseepsis]QMS84804.1 urocanate hydratase [Xianfuyuplasma coldseepsis]
MREALSFTLNDMFTTLPPKKPFQDGIRRAPKREFVLSKDETELALKNALRYIPERWHEELAEEFLEELLTKGRIYGYRFRPEGRIYGKAIEEYKGHTIEGRAFQVMIDNNLDFEIALYPYELVTYGETGRVFQNWMQYHLVKKYLQEMNDEQTLVLMSGHPLGVFATHKNAPRVILTNGLMIGQFNDIDNWNRAAQLGVASYGQMTAGGWMYIGPQGIVHGTYSTLLNAGRSKLGLPDDANLEGKLFVSSGLGGMSGAQGKAIEICGGVGIIAEVDYSRIETRYHQGWVSYIAQTPEEAFTKAKEAQQLKQAIAIAFYGNIVELLEYAVQNKIYIDLLSDQTSCHAVYEGGYCPVGITFEERTSLLQNDKKTFKKLVDEGLHRHYHAIEAITALGTYFFDYGNSFMKAVYDSGIQAICKNKTNDLDGFIWPSYVEDIMGPLLFDYGYGPFRWVCLSGKDDDLDKTDQAAMACIDKDRRFQDRDNYNWIRDAKKNKLVVGTKARILYQDAYGRLQIALRFNEMVRNNEVGPIMLGRDHHDTGGTDSPFRETSNIKDGSNVMSEMATHVALGNASRGMSLVSLHNGGGVGIGKVINGGYGMVLDGSKRVDDILQVAMLYDVMGGVSRRAWARNEHAISTAQEYNEMNNNSSITLPYIAKDSLIQQLVERHYQKGGK